MAMRAEEERRQKTTTETQSRQIVKDTHCGIASYTNPIGKGQH